MFAETFKYIPLITLINSIVFVVHGGLFHSQDVKVDEINEIERTDYVAKPDKDFPTNLEGLDAIEYKKEYLRQLQRDLLWSDPSATPGMFMFVLECVQIAFIDF